MSEDEETCSEFIECIEQLSFCVSKLKDISGRLSELHGLSLREGMVKVGEGVEILERLQEEELK